MNLLPQNPKSRQAALIGMLAAVLLFGFGFFYIRYFAQESPAVFDETALPQASQNAVYTIERNITALQEELKNGFYASLKKYRWIPDTTAPGKANPFIQ
ncbi:hypothetical protein HY250_03040 [Candidatus Azambacteria bacterium]|nr:hypothetical protein [Candidatus Azambacteria bacterium]